MILIYLNIFLLINLFEVKSEQDVCSCPDTYQPVCGVNSVSYNNECLAICNDAAIEYTGVCIIDRVPWKRDLRRQYNSIKRKSNFNQNIEAMRNYKDNNEKFNCSTIIQLEESLDLLCERIKIDPGLLRRAVECKICLGNLRSDNKSKVKLIKKTREMSMKKKEIDCPCMTSWKPVCGKDKKTYYNDKCASCAKTLIEHNGPCREDVSRWRRQSKCSCFKINSPVCGSDGKFYLNKCIAKCKSVKIIENAACKKVNLF